MLLDKKPPTFVNGCPNNINANADEGKTFATITWEHPLVSDNDGKVPHLVLSPAVNLPHPFSEGSHVVQYTIRDSAWNTHSCSFSVKVTGMNMRLITKPYKATDFTESFEIEDYILNRMFFFCKM